MILLYATLFASHFSCANLAESVALGTTNQLISESKAVKNNTARIISLENSVHDNNEKDSILLNSLNYSNKVTDQRLTRIEKNQEKIMQLLKNNLRIRKKSDRNTKKTRVGFGL